MTPCRPARCGSPRKSVAKPGSPRGCAIVDSCRSRQPYSIIAIVSLARRARSAISRLRANVSVEYPPCLRAFLLPLGAPPPAPWTRQTREPLTAGARHCSPLAFERAWHRDAWCIAKSMRLFLRFFARPYPLGGGADVADDRLPGLGDVDVLDRHLLLALRAVFLQRRHLRRCAATVTTCATSSPGVTRSKTAPSPSRGSLNTS